MKNVYELIEGAGSLAESGASHGEIADELDVSRDTASWLVRKSKAGTVQRDDGQPGFETGSDRRLPPPTNSTGSRYTRR